VCEWVNFIVESARRPPGCFRGLRDVVTVETADAVLVGWPDELHQVKDVLAQLNATPLPECGRPPKSYRP
jgi:hypothetical protein